MAVLHYNISGELDSELLLAGSNNTLSNVLLTNVHASTPCYVDLYVKKPLTGKFYLLKKAKLPIGATLVHDIVRFNNAKDQFTLYIKLTKSASETPTVDVIMN